MQGELEGAPIPQDTPSSPLLQEYAGGTDGVLLQIPYCRTVQVGLREYREVSMLLQTRVRRRFAPSRAGPCIPGSYRHPDAEPLTYICDLRNVFFRRW